MSEPALSIIYSAQVASTVTSGSAGDVLIASEDPLERGKYVKATTAARNGRRSDGLAVYAYSKNTAVEIRRGGPISADLSGLSAGAETLVRVSSLGRLERVTSWAYGDDIVGRAHADGSVTLAFGLIGPELLRPPGQINVLDFGAVAYATLAEARAGTDSSNAFNAAFAALGTLSDTSRGGELVIPRGYYRISANLSIARTGHIRGMGTGGRYAGTVLAFDDGVNIVAESTVDSPDGGGADNLRVEALRFYGPLSKTTLVEGGFVARSPVNFSFCSFTGFHGPGLFINGAIGAGYNSNYGSGYKCWFEDNTTDGLRVRGGNGNSWDFIGCVAITNGTPQAVTKAWRVDASAGTYTDLTTDINDAGSGDVAPFPATDEVGDYFAVGHTSPWQCFEYDATSGTLGVGGVVVWEYWNGSAWTAMPTINDRTQAWSTAPDGLTLMRVFFEEPQDWATTTINGSAALYYARCRITTVFTTNPTFGRGYVRDGAGFHDSSFLGNYYSSSQTEGNATPYKITGATNKAFLANAYAELDQGPCVSTALTCAFGGGLNGVGLGAQGAGALHMPNASECAPLRIVNARGTYSIYTRLGVDNGNMIALGWGRLDEDEGYGLSYDGTSGSENWQCRHSGASVEACHYTSAGNARGEGRMGHLHGFLLGSSERLVNYGAAAPTTGTHRIGDIVFNDRTATTTELLWVCTTAGTPGTWTAHNL